MLTAKVVGDTGPNLNMNRTRGEDVPRISLPHYVMIFLSWFGHCYCLVYSDAWLWTEREVNEAITLWYSVAEGGGVLNSLYV